MVALGAMYTAISKFDEAEDVDEALTLEKSPSRKRWCQEHHKKTLGTFCLISAILNIVLLVALSRTSFQSTSSRSGYTGVDQTERWEKHLWVTDYSSNNRTHADALWKALRPAFGAVALDHDWAAARKLPHSQNNPYNTSQGLYILDAYHQLHCLNMIRTSLSEFKDGKGQTFPFSHPTHCLDSLRQAVMCRADDTPLFTIGDFTTGDGQLRQCKDWQYLSNWAADHFPSGYHVPEYLRGEE